MAIDVEQVRSITAEVLGQIEEAEGEPVGDSNRNKTIDREKLSGTVAEIARVATLQRGKNVDRDGLFGAINAARSRLVEADVNNPSPEGPQRTGYDNGVLESDEIEGLKKSAALIGADQWSQVQDPADAPHADNAGVQARSVSLYGAMLLLKEVEAAGAVKTDSADGAPNSKYSMPVLFGDEELHAVEQDSKTSELKKMARAMQYPEQILDGLLVLVGSRGATVPALRDLFANITTSPRSRWDPRPVDVGAALSKYDSPENRRWLHSILEGLLAVSTSNAATGLTNYFRAAGAQSKYTTAGCGLLQSSNGWKTAQVKSVVEGLVAYHQGVSKLSHLVWNMDDRFVGYPAAEVFDAASEAGDWGDAFKMAHANRNDSFIEVLMKTLEARGLGPKLEYSVKRKSPYRTKAAAQRAAATEARSRFKDQWNAQLTKFLSANPESKSRYEETCDKAELYQWHKGKDDQGRTVQLFGAGGRSGIRFVAVIGKDEQLERFEMLDPEKELPRELLKDSSQPWLEYCV